MEKKVWAKMISAFYHGKKSPLCLMHSCFFEVIAGISLRAHETACVCQRDLISSPSKKLQKYNSYPASGDPPATTSFFLSFFYQKYLFGGFLLTDLNMTFLLLPKQPRAGKCLNIRYRRGETLFNG